MDEEGVSATPLGRSGKPSKFRMVYLDFEKMRARAIRNLIGNVCYMPYNAVSFYKIGDIDICSDLYVNLLQISYG